MTKPPHPNPSAVRSASFYLSLQTRPDHKVSFVDFTCIPVYYIETRMTTTVTAQLQPQQPRRIVKATHPTKGETALEPIITVEAEEDDSKGLERSSHSIPTPIADQDPVARELVTERYQQNKESRINTAVELQKSKKERIIHERRLHPENSKTNEGPSANPMSRFLSIFSVDLHPKRKATLTEEELEEEPSEKRLKSSDTIEDDTSTSTSGALPISSTVIMFLSAASVAVIAIILAHRWKKA
jgi:hypothetical protein